MANSYYLDGERVTFISKSRMADEWIEVEREDGTRDHCRIWALRELMEAEAKAYEKRVAARKAGR